jgi:hypothetical protein
LAILDQNTPPLPFTTAAASPTDNNNTRHHHTNTYIAFFHPIDTSRCLRMYLSEKEEAGEEERRTGAPEAAGGGSGLSFGGAVYFWINKVCRAIQNQINEKTDRKKEEKMHNTMVNETEREKRS